MKPVTCCYALSTSSKIYLVCDNLPFFMLCHKNLRSYNCYSCFSFWYYIIAAQTFRPCIISIFCKTSSLLPQFLFLSGRKWSSVCFHIEALTLHSNSLRFFFKNHSLIKYRNVIISVNCMINLFASLYFNMLTFHISRKILGHGKKFSWNCILNSVLGINKYSS